jgi:tetratricopeptide (TPR) repeat protein
LYRHWLPLAGIVLVALVSGLIPFDRGWVAAMQQGDQMAAARQYSDTLGAYRAAASRCPGCPQPWLRQAEVYVEQKRDPEAWAALLEAIQLGGMSDAAVEGLIRLYVARHSERRAIARLEALLARRSGRGDLWIQLGEASRQVDENVQARRAFERALDTQITATQRQTAHFELGLACVESDLPCALEHFEACEDGPDQTLSHSAAWLMVAVQGVKDAESASLPEADPALAQARLGEALYRAGELDLARHAFEHAVEIAPDYVDALSYLGQIESSLGDSAAAVQHLERAIALEPTYPLPYYFLGTHLVRTGRLVTGRDYLLQAHDLDPYNPAICAAVADTYLRAPDAQYAVAERWLHAAVDNAPDDVRFHLLLAHFYVDMLVDPAVRGLAVAEVAVSLAPDNAEAQETLGWAYYLSGTPDLALPPLQRALALAPGEPRLYYRLGQVYEALGNAELARQNYQQAVDLDYNGPIGARARSALQGGPVEPN